ncbi:hypothetical protein C1646_675645 [Rhizophagus diaphanus]|nr:hypothetical protein C1646_675645 [Rhizophagus diaphanus] [Rhizophagus sp. MUCL 43196]
MGVIYVEIPSNSEDIKHFGKAFGKSLNFRCEEHISFTTLILGDNGEVDRHPKWRRALKTFKNAGKCTKQSTINFQSSFMNNISILINISPKVLDTLQDDANMMLIIENTLQYLSVVKEAS